MNQSKVQTDESGEIRYPATGEVERTQVFADFLQVLNLCNTPDTENEGLTKLFYIINGSLKTVKHAGGINGKTRVGTYWRISSGLSTSLWFVGFDLENKVFIAELVD